MAVKIRLARRGAKKRPFYSVVAANSEAPRDGSFLEKLGTYNPMIEDTDVNPRVKLNVDRVQYWLSQGAWPTDRIALFIEKAGIDLPKAMKRKIDLKKAKRVAKPPKDREKARKG